MCNPVVRAQAEKGNAMTPPKLVLLLSRGTKNDYRLLILHLLLLYTPLVQVN